jgi:hypothetical protein
MHDILTGFLGALLGFLIAAFGFHAGPYVGGLRHVGWAGCGVPVGSSD